jgi:hypothetical protein
MRRIDMQNQIDRLLREARELESSAPSAAIAAYSNILQRHPHLISAHLRLSEVWQAQGGYRQSLAEAEDASESLQRTGRLEALPFVTLRLLTFSEREAVRQLICNADWSHPAMVQQAPTLSQHLWLSGAYDEALKLIQHATAKVGPHPLLSYSRANALRYSGRLEEATSELENCLSLDPAHPFAHWSLAYHAPSNIPGGRIDRIRDALRAATDVMARIHLNYALFKELDDIGDTEHAWQALMNGAREKRRSIRYNAVAESETLAQLRATAEILPPTSATHSEDVVPIFVVGMPRTGTTLLERVFSGHRDVSACGELGDFLQALSWGIDKFVTVPPQLEELERFQTLDFAAVGRRYLEKTRPYRADRKFMVDKNPVNVFNAWAIARALPQARILCLVRDPMDACFSNLKELFAGSAYPYSYDLLELRNHYQAFIATAEHWQMLYPTQFRIVRYEDMVTDPDSTISSLSKFCGLPIQESLTDTAANLAPVLTASYAQVREPIHTRGIGAWRRYSKQLEPLRAAFEN